jgi:hypothetical protein
MSLKGLDATGRVLRQSVGAIRAIIRTGPNDRLNQSYLIEESVKPVEERLTWRYRARPGILCEPVAEKRDDWSSM